MVIDTLVTYVKWLTQILIYLFSYLIPRTDGLWVFASHDGKGFSDNSKYQYLYTANNRGEEVDAVWISQKKWVVKELRERGYTAHLATQLTGLIRVFRAEKIINDTGIDVPWWATGGAEIIQLNHGNPIKKVGIDLPRQNSSNLQNILRRSIFWNWDILVLTSNNPLGSLPRQIYRINETNSIVTGYPRNDVFFRNIEGSDIGVDQTALNYVEESSSDIDIILYVPTFRWSDGYQDGEPLSEDILDFEVLNQILKQSDAELFIKLHPKSTFDIDISNYDQIRHIKPGTDIYPIMTHIDSIITDYSSIFFDFLLLDRPIVFYPYDLEKYVKSRGLYYNYESVTPGQIARTPSDFYDLLQESLKIEDEYGRERKVIRSLLYEHTDGFSAQRIHEEVL